MEGDPASLPVLAGQFGQGGIPPYQVLGATRDPGVYRGRYAARVAYVDQHIGMLLDAVRECGLDQNTVIALTSDHGELLGEHGYYFQHGITLLWPVLHVPLILSGPGVPSRRTVSRTAGTVDIAPTLLDLLGVRSSSSGGCPDGQSLVPWFRASPNQGERCRYAFCGRSREVCAMLGPHKYTMPVSSHGDGSLSDVGADASEDRDLSVREEEVAAMLRGDAVAFLGRGGGLLTAGRGGRPHLTEEDRRRMKALGYL
jgi:choline-sulfatase